MNHAMYSTDRHTYLQIVVIILLFVIRAIHPKN